MIPHSEGYALSSAFHYHSDHFCVYIGSSDFESLAQQISVENVAEIRLFTTNNETTLEYDDRVVLTFTPDIAAIISGLEAQGEYVRDIATVIIIDSKCSISVLAAPKLFLISQGWRLILKSMTTLLKRVEL